MGGGRYCNGDGKNKFKGITVYITEADVRAALWRMVGMAKTMIGTELWDNRLHLKPPFAHTSFTTFCLHLYALHCLSRSHYLYAFFFIFCVRPLSHCLSYSVLSNDYVCVRYATRLLLPKVSGSLCPSVSQSIHFQSVYPFSIREKTFH